MRMPDISGIDLLRRLNELKIAVPVIVITGHGDVPLAVEAMKLGAVDFFEKPFDDDALLAAVRSSLGQQYGRQQAQRRSGRKSMTSSRRCRIASARSWKDWSAGIPTRRSPMIWGSARAPWKSTGPT